MPIDYVTAVYGEDIKLGDLLEYEDGVFGAVTQLFPYNGELSYLMMPTRVAVLEDRMSLLVEEGQPYLTQEQDAQRAAYLKVREDFANSVTTVAWSVAKSEAARTGVSPFVRFQELSDKWGACLSRACVLLASFGVAHVGYVTIGVTVSRSAIVG